METRKTIGNVNVLDIRKATLDSVAGIRQIGNVNVLLFSAGSSHLVTRLNIGNINASVEVPDEAKTHTSVGRQVLNKDFLAQVNEPFFLLSIGQVLIEPDILPVEIEEKISGMAVVGQLVCPEPVLGVVQSKTKQVIGETVAYPIMAKFVSSSMTLNPASLLSLADGTEMAVVGSLTIPETVDNEILLQKISGLYVSGNITLHEENLAALQPRLVKSDQKITLIPKGYTLVEKDLLLDPYLLDVLPSRNLYSTGNVVIDAKVTASQLDEAINSIITLKKIYCPAGLRSILKNKSNLLQTDVLFYDGVLWRVENETTITQQQFNEIEDKVSIIVEGVLTFDDQISVETLKSKLARIDVMGIVRCTPDQIGVVETKPGVREGLIQDSTKPVEDTDEDGNQIGNVNMLTL